MNQPSVGSLCRLSVRDPQGTSFIVVEGLRITTWRLHQEAVDVSSAADKGWRKLLSQAGSRNIEIEASGLHFGSPAEARLRQAALVGESLACEVSLNPQIRLRGDFIVGRLAYTAMVDDEATYEVLLQSASLVTIV